jgi:ABC-2 type transport system permease protein
MRSVAFAVAWRLIRIFMTHPSYLIPSIVFPLFFFTAFAGGLSRVEDLFEFPTGYTSFQFVFVLLQSAALGGVFTGFSIARDFEYGFARRLLIAAPNRMGIVLGYALAALARWALTATVLTVVALAVGMEVGGGTVDLFGLYTLAALLNVVGLLWSCGVAMRLRTLQAGPVMNTPIFLALFFSPVFVPLELLEGWIKAVATVNPTTRLLEAGRSLIAGDPSEVTLAFTVALALVALFVIFAFRGLRSAEAAGGS